MPISYITMLGTGNALATRCYNTCFTLHDPSGEVLLVDAGGGNGILTQLEQAEKTCVSSVTSFLHETEYGNKSFCAPGAHTVPLHLRGMGGKGRLGALGNGYTASLGPRSDHQRTERRVRATLRLRRLPPFTQCLGRS